MIRNHSHPFFITHICAHSTLLGPLTKGNHSIDQTLYPLLQTQEEHSLHHNNVLSLKTKHGLTWQEAKAIVHSCPTCHPHNTPAFFSGINPRGLKSNDLWQMDVTQFPELVNSNMFTIL